MDQEMFLKNRFEIVTIFYHTNWFTSAKYNKANANLHYFSTAVAKKKQNTTYAPLAAVKLSKQPDPACV